MGWGGGGGSINSASLDAVLGSTRGGIAARGASLWAELSSPAVNQVLSANASDPEWVSYLAASVQDFRLTLTTGTPVTASDVTGATTIYLSPYIGNRIALYDGVSKWSILKSAEMSLALGTLTSGLPYDVFCYNNNGTPTLELLAWTNGTTRATALVMVDGVWCKTGATTRRYVGTFYTTSTTTTEDSVLNRYVWNANNRVMRNLNKYVSSPHTYGTAAWRSWNNDATNRVQFVVGLVAEGINIGSYQLIQGSNTADNPNAGVMLDGTNSANTNPYSQPIIVASKNLSLMGLTDGTTLTTVGYHFLQATQNGGGAAGTVTWQEFRISGTVWA